MGPCQSASQPPLALRKDCDSPKSMRILSSISSSMFPSPSLAVARWRQAMQHRMEQMRQSPTAFSLSKRAEESSAPASLAHPPQSCLTSPHTPLLLLTIAHV